MPTTPTPGSLCRVINPATGAQVATDRCRLSSIEGRADGRWGWVELRPSVRPGQDHDLGCYPIEWICPLPTPAERIEALVAPILEDASAPDYISGQRDRLVAAAAWLLVLAGSADARFSGSGLTGSGLDAAVGAARSIAEGWVESPGPSIDEVVDLVTAHPGATVAGVASGLCCPTTVAQELLYAACRMGRLRAGDERPGPARPFYPSLPTGQAG